MKTNSCLIRSLRIEDLPEVAEICRLGGYSDWCEGTFATCFKENYHAWILLDQQQVIGFLILLLTGDEIEILNVGVHPRMQRQGVASRLVEHMLEFARAYAVKRIFLEVNHLNLPAIQLYKKYHFKSVGVRKNYYASVSGMENALIFSLEL